MITKDSRKETWTLKGNRQVLKERVGLERVIQGLSYLQQKATQRSETSVFLLQIL